MSSTSGLTVEGHCESLSYVFAFGAVVAIETGNCLVTVIFLHCDEHGSRQEKKIKEVMTV